MRPNNTVPYAVRIALSNRSVHQIINIHNVFSSKVVPYFKKTARYDLLISDDPNLLFAEYDRTIDRMGRDAVDAYVRSSFPKQFAATTNVERAISKHGWHKNLAALRLKCDIIKQSLTRPERLRALSS